MKGKEIHTMAKIYKGYEKCAGFALAHIKANNIKCRYYGWVMMAGDIDGVKIDGKIRYFNNKTHKEVR